MTSPYSRNAFRALLVTTSVAGLAAGWTLGERSVLAQGIEVVDTTVAGVLNPADASTDYILISNATVTADGVVNEGEIGDVTPNATGILVTNGSNVTGGISNSGNLLAEEEGIVVEDGSTLDGGIANSGVLNVGSEVAEGDVDEALGIGVFGTDVDTTIDNNGVIDVSAFDSDPSNDPNATAAATAIGIQVESEGSLNAVVNNSGTVTVSATATDDDSPAATAIGISTVFENFAEGASSNAASTVTNSSASTIDVTASAIANPATTDAEADAEAIGIEQVSFGALTTDFSASNSGSLLVDSMATANANSADAFAFSSGMGISQWASGSGVGSAMLTANNSALIQVSAVATATTTTSAFSADATAVAAGIAQDVDLIGTTTSSVSNSGDITVTASATIDAQNTSPFAEAEAQGIRQTARSGETNGPPGTLTAELSVNQTGNVDVSAIASSEGRANGDVEATAQGIVQEADGLDSAVLSVTNSGNVAVTASADGEVTSQFSVHESISAQATGIAQESYTFVGPTDLTVSSSGSITVGASVGLDADIDTDRASAESFGIRQTSSGFGEIDATANVTGDLDVTATSQARETTPESVGRASSRAVGIDQQGQSFGDSIQFVATTDGNTNVTAVASAEGDYGAFATANATGISQSAIGAIQAGASASNTGTMIIESWATTDGGEFGVSRANAFGAGIKQFRNDGFSGSGFGQGQFTGQGIINSSLSTIDVTVTASALGTRSGSAIAGGGGIFQDVSRVTDTTANADNSGGISVDVGASASNTGDFIFSTANATAQGISQSVYSGSGTVSGNITSGLLSSSARADTTALGPSSGGEALSTSIGLDQWLTAEAAAVSGNIASSISLEVSAVANATAASTADADATAFGIQQILSYAGSGSSNVLNSGNIDVSASANADGADFASNATAEATGILIVSNSLDLLNVQANNAGNMTVTATAAGNGGSEEAFAAGIHVAAQSGSGTVANNGTMTVHASAPNGSADAYGILVQSNGFTGTIGNYGTMVVTAEEADPGTAFGLVIEAAESPSGNGATIENDGFLSAEVAISTLNAPGPNQINQLGGTILGDIWLAESYGDTVDFFAGTIEGDTLGSGADDVFNFRSGSGMPTATYIGQLDGLSSINVHPGMAYLDGGVSNTGSFNVLDGGSLTLSSNGPTQVDVTDYSQAAGGVLAYEITPDPTSAAQINATNVSLDGAVTVTPLPGFYPNAVTYEEVVVSSGPTGQWATEIDTALLDVEAIYQNDNTVDLSVTRIPFDEVEGLNENEQSLGDGLEEIYESSEGTPIGEALEQLFALDPEGYREALAALGGAEHAQTLLALLDSQGMFQNAVLGHLGHGGSGGGSQTAGLRGFDFVSSQIAAAATDESGASAPARQPQLAAAEGRGREAGTLGIWGRAFGNFGDNDGDANAVGFEQEQYGFAAGADIAVAEDAVLGIAGGYSETDLDFDNNNKVDFDGFQVAAYGSFAPGAWYLDGMAAYAWYDNDSRRATIGGTAKGDYDSEVFSAYAETGYGFDLRPVTITPFAGLGYVHAETDSFTESGAGAFNLSVDSSDAESLTTTLGLDVSARLQVDREMYFIPEVRVGWEHEYLDDQQSIGAHFAGMPASSFTTLSSQVADDSAVVGAGFTVEMGNVWQLFLDYDGKLNEDYSQHAVSGGVKLSW